MGSGVMDEQKKILIESLGFALFWQYFSHITVRFANMISCFLLWLLKHNYCQQDKKTTYVLINLKKELN
jgi:hypothetical protein